MKVYKTTPDIGLNSCCEKDPKLALFWLEAATPGEIITIEVLEMSEEEYNSLPEFTGP